MGIIDILYWSFMIGVCLLFGSILVHMLLDLFTDGYFIKKEMEEVEKQIEINRELMREREEILNEYKKY